MLMLKWIQAHTFGAVCILLAFIWMSLTIFQHVGIYPAKEKEKFARYMSIGTDATKVLRKMFWIEALVIAGCPISALGPLRLCLCGMTS